MSNKKTNLLIGICSGIALYKTCSVVSNLTQAGYDVKVVMTTNATKLVSPVVFAALSHNKVYSETFEEQWSDSHVSLCSWADGMIIAPVTANTLAKIAHGIADDLLTTTVLALPQQKPLLLFPAMNDQMWMNPMTQENIQRIRSMKRKTPVCLVEPKQGRLACGTDNVVGRLPEPEEIIREVKKQVR